MKVTLHDKGSISKAHVATRIRGFQRGNQRALATAAERATAKSQSIFTDRLSGRGRSERSPRSRISTDGAFPDYLTWSVTGDRVSFDINKIAAVAPYWIIQEIGTDKSAIGHRKDSQESFSVKSQVGRLIPYGLTWSGYTGRDQIIPSVFSKVTKSPRAQWHASRGDGIKIGQEIKGKGFVRIGATQGRRTLRAELGKEFAATLSKPKR